MPWPFRTRRRPAVDPVPPRVRRSWVALPVLRPTVPPSAGMVTVPTAQVAGGRSMLALLFEPDSGAVARGHVTGLAVPVPASFRPAPEDSDHDISAATLPVVAPLGRIAAVVEGRRVGIPLTVTDGDLVGQAAPAGEARSEGSAHRELLAQLVAVGAVGGEMASPDGGSDAQIWPPPGYENVYRAAYATPSPDPEIEPSAAVAEAPAAAGVDPRSLRHVELVSGRSLRSRSQPADPTGVTADPVEDSAGSPGRAGAALATSPLPVASRRTAPPTGFLRVRARAEPVATGRDPAAGPAPVPSTDTTPATAVDQGRSPGPAAGPDRVDPEPVGVLGHQETTATRRQTSSGVPGTPVRTSTVESVASDPVRAVEPITFQPGDPSTVQPPDPDPNSRPGRTRRPVAVVPSIGARRPLRVRPTPPATLPSTRSSARPDPDSPNRAAPPIVVASSSGSAADTGESSGSAADTGESSGSAADTGESSGSAARTSPAAQPLGRTVAAVRHRAVLSDPLPPVEPSAPPDGPGPRPTGVDWRLQYSEPVPSRIAADFRRTYGVAVDHVPVRRGAPAAEVVRAAGARAASYRGEVLLPLAAGPLDSSPGSALLAHELAHIAQDHAFGGTPPAEASEAGRDLEARAVAAEWHFGGRTDSTAPVPPLVSGGVPESRVGTRWSADPPAAHQVHRAPSVPPADTMDRVREVLGTDRAQRSESEPHAAPPEPAAHKIAAVRTDLAGSTAMPAADVRTLGRLADLRTDLERLNAELVSTRRREQTTAQRLERDTAELRAWVTERLPDRAVDLDRPSHLEELTGRLYERFRGRLRQELLVDRERSGRLVDFH